MTQPEAIDKMLSGANVFQLWSLANRDILNI